jgi:hypothetical protein
MIDNQSRFFITCLVRQRVAYIGSGRNNPAEDELFRLGLGAILTFGN